MLNAKPNNYNLRSFQELRTEENIAVKNGLETLSYPAPQLWSLLPKGNKPLTSLGSFKKVMKKPRKYTGRK